MKAALSSAVLSYLLVGNAVKTKVEEAVVPTGDEQSEVSGVMESMKSWGEVAGGAANIGMYMEGNSLKMDHTHFYFSGNTGSTALPEAITQGITSRKVNLGTCHFGTYQKDDVKEMKDNHVDANGVLGADATIRLAALLQTPSLVQMGASAPTNMYMHKDVLSMDRTIFTLNVGTPASFLQESASSRGASSVMSVGELNINMYMYGNEISMNGTNFQINAQSFPFDASMHNGGLLGGDLARLILLNLGTMTSAVQDMDVQFGTHKETSDTEKVWSWFKGWSSSVSASSANLNMHMYHNKMVIDGTEFKMNIGADLSAAQQLALERAVQKKAADSSASHSNASDEAPTDWKLYDSGLSMTNAEFNLKAGSLLQDSARKHSEAPVPAPGSDINMYMYENQVSMKHTDFTMNVGNAKTLLLQESARLESASRWMTMDAGKLNVRMYMFENEMTMKDSVFSWTITG